MNDWTCAFCGTDDPNERVVRYKLFGAGEPGGEEFLCRECRAVYRVKRVNGWEAVRNLYGDEPPVPLEFPDGDGVDDESAPRAGARESDEEPSDDDETPDGSGGEPNDPMAW